VQHLAELKRAAGLDGSQFSPGSETTRAQSAVIVERLLQVIDFSK
jgi:hypothetical protein